MKERIYQLLGKLEANQEKRIVYYEQNKRVVKTFAGLAADVRACIGRLESLALPNKVVGLIGPTSYYWLVIDLACIYGGYHSVAIPESFDQQQLNNALEEADVLLMDHVLKDRLESPVRCYYFNCFRNGCPNDLEEVPIAAVHLSAQMLLDNYGTAYTSGTSEQAKKIRLSFPEPEPEPEHSGLKGKWAALKAAYGYKASFWSRKDNCIIVFMPFSHLQQRTFVRMALFRNFNIVLSDPVSCIKHLILERPNIMIAVPVFYEAIAGRIQQKLNSMSALAKNAVRLYNLLGVHHLRSRNPLQRLCRQLLFRDIMRICGGRADYFVTGSAAINPSVLQTFYKIGVRIYEAYGQSETAVISMNTDRAFRIGSVGKPLLDIVISPASEVLLKYDEKRFRYNRDVLQVKDGYIHTGDVGCLDKDGFLFLQGRLDDVIILGNGKKVFPMSIESRLREHKQIRQAIIFGNTDSKISAVIHADPAGMKQPDLINNIIGLVNKALAPHEQIVAYVLADEPFTPGNGLMTHTFKPRRKQIIHHYNSRSFTRVT